MRIADTFGEKAKTKCQHHLTSRRNETTTTTTTSNPLQSLRRSQTAAAALSSSLTQHEIQICIECCDVPFRGQTDCVCSFAFYTLYPLLSLSFSSLASSGASSIVARCKLQSLIAVSFFIFESSSCTRSMESSASYSCLTYPSLPHPRPAATAASSRPASVPAATAGATLFHAVCENQSFAFNAAFPRMD